jgi:hypothetical protein
VGDSAVRSRSARRISGVASKGRGPLKAASLRVTGVEVSVRRLGGSKKTCSWLRSTAGTLVRGSCTSPRWVRASGSSSWRVALRRSLPAGHYEIRSRAGIAAGFKEAVYSAKDGNKVELRVP